MTVPVPARIRAKLLGSCALTVAAVLTGAPAVTVVALAATCAAIPLAAGLLGGAGLLRAVLGAELPRTNSSGRSTQNGSDDPAGDAAAEAR
ncbi:hypothetical protein ACFPIJ_61130 [Dactylosporangium cerinum]|uniref:Uncharacterized protein n=1 Tax=Dactylosporangium cerinum TaxID=1434730 RepID=A0ABV9WIK1_9ACTN